VPVTRFFAILAWLLAGILVLSLGLVVWCVWLLDLNDHKEYLRGLTLQTLGLDIEIAGRIEHGWSDGPFLSIRNLTARQNGETVAAIDQLQIELSIAPLLEGQIRPSDRCRTGVRCQSAYTVVVSSLALKRLPRESSIS